TGTAAIITAIVGLITLLSNLGGNAKGALSVDQTSNSPSPAVVTTTPWSRTTPTSSSPTTSSPLPDGVLVQSQLTMRSPDEADLEKGIVGPTIREADLYLYCSGGRCALNAVGSGIMSTINGLANKSTCIAALSSRNDNGMETSRLNKGDTLCIQTNDGHVGALQILGLPGVGTMEFSFSYTLWR